MQASPGIPPVTGTVVSEADALAEEIAALKNLAGAVAHELNNVLTGVLGNLSLLEEAGTVDGSGIPAIAAEALLAARGGVSLTEKLEAYAERLRLEPSPSDMNSLMMEAVWQLRGALGPTKVQFTPPAEGVVARVDPAMMIKAIVSLGVSVAAAFREGPEVLRLEAVLVARSELPEMPLPDGAYAHTKLSWVGNGARTDVISDGVRASFSGPRSARNSNWGLASVAGFARQSGGNFSLSTCTPHRVEVDFYLPAEA